MKTRTLLVLIPVLVLTTVLMLNTSFRVTRSDKSSSEIDSTKISFLSGLLLALIHLMVLRVILSGKTLTALPAKT
jgi:hypothetical protein